MLLVTTSIVLLMMNPQLGFLTLLTLPLLLYRAVAFGKTIRPLSLSIQNQLGVLTTLLEQNLRGARIVKAFAQEDAEIDRFDAREQPSGANWRSVRRALEAVQGPQLILISNISTVMVIGYGGLLIIRNQLTLGELVAFTTYLGQLANPVRMFGMIAPVVGMAISSAERVFEILDARSEVRRVAGRHRRCRPSRATSVSRMCRSPISATTRCWMTSRWKPAPGQVIALLGTDRLGQVHDHQPDPALL